MLQKTSDYIESLMLCDDAVRRQFEVSNEELTDERAGGNLDPLREQEHEVVPGLINKYHNRVLCLLTLDCPAYCRFCTRRRLVSSEGEQVANHSRIAQWKSYLEDHPEVTEVIVSGGDPFVVEDELFVHALVELSNITTVKVMRIGTRAPVTEPDLVTQRKLDAISLVRQPVYVGIHFEHPAEITQRTIWCVRDLRYAGAILYSQTVFLEGVNADAETLRELFTRLLEIGVRPYYLYRCDPIPGAGHFRVDFEKERRIMSELRRTLSGLACPTYVIDAPDGSGKIPVPLDFWDIESSAYRDFDGRVHTIE
jgi:lysine 2,3-aminomutase